MEARRVYDRIYGPSRKASGAVSGSCFKASKGSYTVGSYLHNRCASEEAAGRSADLGQGRSAGDLVVRLQSGVQSLSNGHGSQESTFPLLKPLQP